MSDKPEYSIFDPAEIPCQEISDPAVLSKVPLVSAAMVTYNHAPYIAQAIEGVLQQKTDFPFELVIGEDCSTDGTKEIVFEYQKKYPNIIRVITSEQNVGMHKNADRVRKAYRGKYIAFCEGDDYWTDPLKLQKQVDFLEANPDYGMVHSDYDKLIDKTGRIIKSVHKQNNVRIPTNNLFEELLINNFIGTLTVCVRANSLKQAIINNHENWENWMMGDKPLWMEISRHSKIGYINKSLAVYRRLEESASSTKNIKKKLDFLKSSYAVKFYFIEKYGCSKSTKETVLRDYHRMILRYSLLLLDKKNARKSFEFLQTLEKDGEQRVINYCHYFGSKNRLNQLFTKTLLRINSFVRVNKRKHLHRAWNAERNWKGWHKV